MSAGGKFGVVDQALNTLKKVEQYIMAGIETTIDVSLDLVECDKKNSEEKLNDLKDIMLQYAAMERDLKQFSQAVSGVKAKAQKIGSDEEWPDLNEDLDVRLTDLKKGNNDAQLESHEKYLELKQKIWDILHPDEAMPTQDTAVDDDEDIAVVQQDIITRCPYTAKEMTNPWKNKLCNHNYDQEAVNQMLKSRKAVRCPVNGCINEKALHKSDLEENKELKKFIEMKNRKGKQKHRGGASQSQRVQAIE